MGNKLVCCRWKWIESPEFTGLHNKRFDENGGQYTADMESYPNGVIGQHEKLENGGASNSHMRYSNDEIIHAKPMVYENKYPTSYICPAPAFYRGVPPSIAMSANQVPVLPSYIHPHQQHQQQLYNNELSSYRDSWMIRSTEMLQHISEREPEDVDNDPSINARHPTLFLRRNKQEIERNIQAREQQHYQPTHHQYHHSQHPQQHYNNQSQSCIRQYSSCSNILLDDSTISQPGPALALKTLALAIRLHLVEKPSDESTYDVDYYEIFDERIHPIVGGSGGSMSNGGANKSSISHPSSQSNNNNISNNHHNSVVGGGALQQQQQHHQHHHLVIQLPSHKEIYRFLRHIFNMAQLTPECAIVTLVYLERLISSAEMEVLPWSWRRQVLASVLLASKVWDDQAVWNADYCQIIKDLAIEDVNELERRFLELIQFNINVPASVYAHYYFDLLQLGRSHGLYGTVHRAPLLWDRALRLEARPCPAGPLQDYNPQWWTRPVPLARFPSWDSVLNPPRMLRPVVIS